MLAGMSLRAYAACAHTQIFTSCARERAKCSPAPHGGEHLTLWANASLGLWMNNSECWHSWAEPLLFMVGIGTDRWLLLILRTSRQCSAQRRAVFSTFMSVCDLHLNHLLPSTALHSSKFSSHLCPLPLRASPFLFNLPVSPCHLWFPFTLAVDRAITLKTCSDLWWLNIMDCATGTFFLKKICK